MAQQQVFSLYTITAQPRHYQGWLLQIVQTLDTMLVHPSKKSRKHRIALVGALLRPQLDIQDKRIAGGETVLPECRTRAVIGRPVIEALQCVKQIDSGRSTIAR